MRQLVGYRPPRIAMSLVLVAVVAHLAIGAPLHNGVPITAAIGTLPFYMAAITYFVAMDRTFCPYEECKSLQEFGGEYDQYTRRVRRWL